MKVFPSSPDCLCSPIFADLTAYLLSLVAASDDEDFELRTFGGYSMHTDTIFASASAFVSAINGMLLSKTARRRIPPGRVTMQPEEQVTL